MAGLIFISGILDYKYRKIPDLIIILILGWALFLSSAPIFERIAGFIVTAIPLFILALPTGKIKGGDYKYLVACATALGIDVFVSILFFSCIAAFIWSLVRREKTVPLAFVFMVGYVVFSIL